MGNRRLSEGREERKKESDRESADRKMNWNNREQEIETDVDREEESLMAYSYKQGERERKREREKKRKKSSSEDNIKCWNLVFDVSAQGRLVWKLDRSFCFMS